MPQIPAIGSNSGSESGKRRRPSAAGQQSLGNHGASGSQHPSTQGSAADGESPHIIEIESARSAVAQQKDLSPFRVQDSSKAPA
eukprot:gene3539-2303_t